MKARIAIKSAQPPSEGRKRWKIESADGKFFTVDGPVANQLTVGNVYDVEIKEFAWQGKTFQSIESASLAQGSIAPPPAASGSGTGAVQHAADPVPERIFICGAINHAIASNQLSIHEPEQIHKAICGLREVWKRSLGRPPNSFGAEMNDDIPF